MNREGSRWSGHLYDGLTADRQPIVVTLDPTGICVHRSDGTSALWPIGAVRQTQGAFGREHVRLEHGTNPTQTLLVEDQTFAAALQLVFPKQNPTLRDRRRTTRLIAWSTATFVALLVLYLVGANVAADWAAKRIPLAWEAAMGTQVSERIAAQNRRCGDSASLAALDGVLRRLTAAAAATPYQFRLIVVRDTSINAFAAPGGLVVVNSGLLAAASTPEEVAGVLAHETQHVVRRHSTRAILRELPLRVAVSAVFGGGSGESFASAASTLGALSYRRDDEAEADGEGIRLLQAANIDSRGLVSFMKTLERRGEGAPRLVSYLTDHPYTADRVAVLQALAADQHGEPTPLMDSATWSRVRGMCTLPTRGHLAK